MERVFETSGHHQNTIVTTDKRLPILIEAAEAVGGVYHTKTVTIDDTSRHIRFHFIGDFKQFRTKISEIDLEARKRNIQQYSK